MIQLHCKEHGCWWCGGCFYWVWWQQVRQSDVVSQACLMHGADFGCREYYWNLLPTQVHPLLFSSARSVLWVHGSRGEMVLLHSPHLKKIKMPDASIDLCTGSILRHSRTLRSLSGRIQMSPSMCMAGKSSLKKYLKMRKASSNGAQMFGKTWMSSCVKTLNGRWR